MKAKTVNENQSGYSKTYDIVMKNWPLVTNEKDKFFMKIVDVCAKAEYNEKEIIELCDLISDFGDEKYSKGIDEARDEW